MTINTKTNPSVCIYPWSHSYLGCKYERKLCCIALDATDGQKTLDEDWWNGDYMKTVRLKMLNGEKLKDCEPCYANEALQVPSLRQEATNDKNVTEDIFETQEDGSVDVLPTYFDFRTIHCNLQCVSCGDVYSSTHIKLKEEMFPDPNRKSFKPDYAFEAKMAETMIESIRHRRCNKIYWAGGEPMMALLHWQVMEFIENQRKIPGEEEYINSISMHYNTNLTKLKWQGKSIPAMLEPNQPIIQASLDGTHETIEYTRDGCNWKDIETNFKEYYKYLNKHKQFGVASVLSAPVIFDIDRWMEFYKPYNPYLHNHKYMTNIDYYPTAAPSMLAIELFPQRIFDRVVGNAIDKFKQSGLRNSRKSVQILKSYKKQKEQRPDIFDNDEKIREVKGLTMYRDKWLHTKRSFGELIKITDREAFEWYDSIKPIFPKHMKNA